MNIPDLILTASVHCSVGQCCSHTDIHKYGTCNSSIYEAGYPAAGNSFTDYQSLLVHPAQRIRSITEFSLFSWISVVPASKELYTTEDNTACFCWHLSLNINRLPPRATYQTGVCTRQHWQCNHP